MIFGAGPTSI